LDEKVASYWVCGYANRQYKLGEEICGDLENSAFRRAMRLAKGTLLVLDKDAVAFDRIWCDFELAKTLVEPKMMLDIVTMVDGIDSNRQAVLLSECNPPNESAHAKTLREEYFPIDLISKGIECLLEDGRCTVPSDKESIIQNITATTSQRKDSVRTEDLNSLRVEAFDQLNCSLHAYLALTVWPQAVRRGAVSKLYLPEALKSDTTRTSLFLDLSNFKELDNDGLKTLSGCLALSLEHLSLCFRRCSKITDQGLIELARCLPPDLQSLRLNFQGCAQITDTGLTSLAGHIGRFKCLQQLRLDFANCTDIDIPSLKALADNIPRSVKDIVLVFLGTNVNCNIKTVKELLNIKKNAGALERIRRKDALIRT